ncbi:MAG: hypothetical protein ACI4MG_09570 [Aristaeellaceae bacterium]
MKKLLSLILALCLLAVPITAIHAENTYDLSSYGNDELLMLLAAVQNEVVARRIEKTAHLTAGRYVAGRDIPAGDYILTSAGTENDHGDVCLRAGDDAHTKKYSDYLGRGDQLSLFITIEEGDILELPFSFTLTIFTRIVFE